MFIIDELAMYNCPKGMNKVVLYCIVLYCIVLYCIVLYCIVLYCIVLWRCSAAHLYSPVSRDVVCADRSVMTSSVLIGQS